MVIVVVYFQPLNKTMSPQVSCVRRALDNLDMVTSADTLDMVTSVDTL